MIKVGRKSVGRRTVTTPVRYVKLGESFTRSDEFKEEFISGRCKCCGSREHSLLRVKELSRTRNGRTTYEYSCPAASYEDLYKIDRYYPLDELNINFQFNTLLYAQAVESLLKYIVLMMPGLADVRQPRKDISTESGMNY